MIHQTNSLRRYLFAVGVGVATPLAVIALLNYVVDPFRVFHACSWSDTYPRDPRRIIPGLARTTEYDAIVVGTSHSDNFLPTSIRATLGWNALRMTLPGSTFPQQKLAAETALATGRVRHVLWGLDLFAFYADPNSLDSDDGEFPVELYRASPRRIPNYLLNLATAKESLRLLAGKGDRGLESRGTWHARFEFAERAALEKGHYQLGREWELRRSARRDGWTLVERNLRESLEPLIRAHPDVEFCLLLPPISGLAYLPDVFHDSGRFQERLNFREQLCRRLASLPNVRIYDFEVAVETTHELSQYMDLTHFGLPVNDWMLEQVAADAYRLTPQSLSEHQARFATATRQLLTKVLSEGHPWSRPLGLSRFEWSDEFQPRTLAAVDGLAERR